MVDGASIKWNSKRNRGFDGFEKKTYNHFNVNNISIYGWLCLYIGDEAGAPTLQKTHVHVVGAPAATNWSG